MKLFSRPLTPISSDITESSKVFNPIYIRNNNSDSFHKSNRSLSDLNLKISWTRKKPIRIIKTGTTCKLEIYSDPKKCFTWAVKKFNTQGTTKHHKEEVKKILLNEYKILNKLCHKNIINVFSLRIRKRSIVLEFIPFDLYTMMIMCIPPSLEERECFMRQICKGVAYLHNNNIVHRDLKLENIMVSFNEQTGCTIKIIDFGSAVDFSHEEKPLHYCHGMGGSEPLMAPEVLDKLSYIGYPVDIWSLGVIMYQLFNLSGKPRLPWKIAKRTSDFDFDCFLKDHSIAFSSRDALYLKLLILDPLKRPNASDLLNDHFFNKNCNEICHDRTRRLCKKIWTQKYSCNYI